MTRLPPGLLPPRHPQTHKGDLGHVLVLSGSVGLTGAATLCSLGALRTGAGLVTLGIPKSLNDMLEVKLTEVMTVPLPETTARSLSPSGIPAIMRLLDRIDVVAIGPGLSQHPQTRQFVRRLLPKLSKPCVLDADGLNALIGNVALLKSVREPLIITPHPGEMARLIGRSADEIQRHREEVTRDVATQYRLITVLKGNRTVVANVDGDVYVNETGGPAMASGGSGDVLTGVIAALLGQGLSPFNAARLGVYLHGLAGDLAAEEIGPVGLIASDLIDTIPDALRQYQHGNIVPHL